MFIKRPRAFQEVFIVELIELSENFCGLPIIFMSSSARHSSLRRYSKFIHFTPTLPPAYVDSMMCPWMVWLKIWRAASPGFNLSVPHAARAVPLGKNMIRKLNQASVSKTNSRFVHADVGDRISPDPVSSRRFPVDRVFPQRAFEEIVLVFTLQTYDLKMDTSYV